MTGAIYRPANPAYRTPAYRKGRTRLLATDPTCVHCGRPATEADHQPPLALHRHVDGTDCCRLVASCASCGRRQGNAVLGGLRAGAVLPSQASAPPPAAVEPVGWSSDDPIWDKSWLEGLRDVPTDATWPRLMTPPHPAAVDSYGAELAAYAEARSGKPLRWWQRLAAARLLEHDIHGELVWPAVDVTVARQVGKSWLLRELCLWRIHQGDRFGEPQTVVHTGKDLNICVEIQRPARRWARGERFADVYKVRDANGTEQIELLADGSRWMVRAKEGVYGLSASLAVVDEGWAVPATMIEEGLVPTMVELTSSQLLLVSTAHRKATALMLARRAVALADLGATDRDLWMEWSASPVVDVADPAGWRAASPQWSPKRHRLIGQRLAAAQSGEATDDPDEPNPLEAFVAQWLNRWPARCRHAGKGEPLVPDDAWAACRGALSGAAGPGIVALEENRGEGAAAAFVATDGAGRFEVDGRACPSWSEAIDLARFFVNARPGSRIYVGARMNNQLPDDFPDRHLARKAGVTETGRGLSLLRALVAESRVVHDDTADIDDQIARARVHNLTGGGLGLVNNNARGDLFRAALWALDAAQEAAPNRGFTDIYDLTSWPAPADSARGRPPGDDTDVISGVGGSGRMMSRPPSTGRFARALIPREVPDPAPRDRLPNDNPPVGTTGPNVPEGFGDTHVMYPAVNPPFQAEAWAGWPVDWATPYLETSPTWSTFFGYGADDPAGFLKRVSTVGTCVDKNSRQLASFPVYAVRDRHPVPLPSWYTRSPEPELYADWVEFMKAAVNSYQLRGETLLWATSRFADGFPARFIVLEPNNIEITDQGDYFLIRDNGERVQISRADVCHVKYQRAPGVTRRGLGPLGWAARHLVSADVLDRYAVNIAAYGVSSLLRAPGRVTDQQAEEIRNAWAAARRANPGVPAIVSDGLEYEQLSLSPRDMALLDLKIFDLQMIASAFGVPPGLVGLPQAGGGLEYSSVDMLADHHWRDALRPMAQAFSGALSNWLLPYGTVLEFNPDRYVQPGLGERAQAHATLHGIVDEAGRRAMTVNEIRVVERFEPYPDDPGLVPVPSPSPGGPGVTDEIDGLIGAAP